MQESLFNHGSEHGLSKHLLFLYEMMSSSETNFEIIKSRLSLWVMMCLTAARSQAQTVLMLENKKQQDLLILIAASDWSLYWVTLELMTWFTILGSLFTQIFRYVCLRSAPFFCFLIYNTYALTLIAQYNTLCKPILQQRGAFRRKLLLATAL